MEGTIERIKALGVPCKLFFGRCSYPALGLTKIINCCLNNKRLLRASHYADGEFIAKFMCAVNNSLYQWLRQCSNANSVEETTTSLLDYSTLFEDIVMNMFQYILPLAIKRYERPPPPLGGGSDRQEREKKCPKQAEQIKNEAMIEDWKLRPGERWETVFCIKSGEAPQLLMGCKLCLKFWVKGVCYDDCKHKASHVRELNEEDMAAGTAYIHELRKE